MQKTENQWSLDFLVTIVFFKPKTESIIKQLATPAVIINSSLYTLGFIGYPKKYTKSLGGSLNSIRKVNARSVSPPMKVATINDLSALNGQLLDMIVKRMILLYLEICCCLNDSRNI